MEWLLWDNQEPKERLLMEKPVSKNSRDTVPLVAEVFAS
jgi:hypothetical protein